jgi:NitT/TauT family transport system substrate-binding protein
MTAPRRRAWHIATAILLLVIGLAYLGTRYLSQNHAPVAALEKLSIAAPTVPHAALLYVAAAKGYFTEEGLEVTMIPTIHGKAAIGLVEEGKADLGTAAEVVFVLASTEGGGLAIAANMFNAGNDLAVVARRDSGIAKAKDLGGKRVGVTFGTAGEYFLWAFLIRHKLLPESVKLVDLPPGQLVKEIAAGTIDAIATWQPNVLGAQHALNDNAVTFLEPLAYTETFNIVGRSDFLRERSEAVAKLLRAILKAEEFNQAKPEESLNLIASRLEIDVNALQATWKYFEFRVDLAQSQLTTLEEQARWAMARGYLPKDRVPNFLPHLYLDALLSVRPERVTVVH